MRMHVGCVDGKTYTSKEFTREELAEQIKEVDGYIGFGSEAGTRVSSVDEALGFISEMCRYSTENTYQVVTLQTEEYGDITINVRHIVWWSYTE